MKKTGVVILATILMVTLTVIGSYAAEAPKSIIIGALVSMTGPDALTGQPSKHGYQLGADMINGKGGVYLADEFLGFKRFYYGIVSPHLLCKSLINRFERTGKKDHGNCRGLRVQFYFFTQLVAVDLRHFNVGKHHFRPEAFHRGQGILTIAHRLYFEIFLGKGQFDRIEKVMDGLREAGIFFAVSTTQTSQNTDVLTSDAFIDFLVEKGCILLWNFHYVPIGRDPDLSLMATPEQRSRMRERLAYFRATKPMLFVDFWNDGCLTQGCIAAGRKYFHVNARGDVEPCVFCHFAF
jgi:hypothetical protein